jgi:uncharacterized protein (TIGR02452 family)
MDRHARAKWARETINKRIPALLASDAVAASGVQGTLLSQNHPALPAPTASDPIPPVQVWQTDTLTAAEVLHKRGGRVAILNMASCLQPGGGVLRGAKTQEEFLCTRTTLYPALRDEFYRLPEVSTVYTRDTLVFRNAAGEDLPKADFYHVDVVTAAMLRSPELAERDGQVTWADEGSKETVLAKMRCVMRSLVMNGVKRVVLGAWGCGAYGNPVEEVANLWRTVLVGGRRGRKERWTGIEEIVFAITNAGQVTVFRERFPSEADGTSSTVDIPQ